MGREENLMVAQKLSKAFENRDMAALDGLIADNVVWHQIGAPDLRGKEALRATPGPGTGADYDLTGEAHDIIASDDHAVILTNAVGTRGGRTLNYRTAEIYHIRNGQVTERWAFSDDTAAIATFFG
jgi:uncharacterized protein